MKSTNLKQLMMVNWRNNFFLYLIFYFLIKVYEYQCSVVICPFCEKKFSSNHFVKIRQRLSKMYSLNPQQISVSMLPQLFKDVIDQHEFCWIHNEELIIFEGLKKNYPININFNGLSDRVLKLVPKLNQIIEGKNQSYYKNEALSTYKKIGSSAQARQPTFLINRFENFQVILSFDLVPD